MLALRIAFGLALYAHACFLLGIAGQLRAIPLIALAGLVSLLAVRVVARGARGEGQGEERAWRFGWLALVPPAVLALYPPIAFDETLYHLPFVQAFARDGAIRFLPELRFPVFSVLHEALCVPAFLLAGDVATHFVALAELVLLAALMVEWKSRAGWLAAALFLGSPLVVMLATTLHVEIALALFLVAGFYAIDRERYALAGFFFGSACSVKYLGFFFAFAALALVVARRRGIVSFASTCALTALPMTAWIYFHSGDPWFPFLKTSVWSLAPPSGPPPLADRAMLIWNVTFARDRVGMQPPVTPFLAAMVTVLVVAAVKREAFARYVLLLGAGYLVMFNFMPQDSRYLVPLLALVCVAAATFVASRWPRFAPLVALLAIAPGIAYAGYRIARQGVPPADRAAWLAQRVPEYRALRLAGTERVYACRGEQLKSYAAGSLVGDHNGPFSYARILADDTRALAENLRRIEARYYLVAKRACAPPRANGGMELVYEDAGAQLWRVSRSAGVLPSGRLFSPKVKATVPATRRDRLGLRIR